MSLRSEIYKGTLLDLATPRLGDLAEVVRDHHRTETGLVVQVVGNPHRCESFCSECGQAVTGYFVEVASEKFAHVQGPYFYPIAWLRRINLTS